MKRVDLSWKEGRIEYHAECPERLTAEQKYKLVMAAIGGATLAALVYMVGWVALAIAVGGLLVYGAGVLIGKD